MNLSIKRLTLGIASTNAYIIGDQDSGEAIVIDPVDNASLIHQSAQDAGWTIKLILATHAHFDHVLASADLKSATGAPFWVHRDCLPFLENLPAQGRMFGFAEFPAAAVPDHLLENENVPIQVGAIKLQTLYTPGHAPGHLAFYMEDARIVFSGDTLFQGSIGRTDLPGGSYEVLLDSITSKLLTLEDDVRVLAGHMGETTIGRERYSNPFLV
jgi:glyoxylase-like metal-dependent hydrolase (beta-lactamase superfamily II)